MNKEYIHLIYLAACAVNGQTPDKKYIEQMNLCLLYRFAKYHTMTAVSYMALEHSGIVTDKEWMQAQSEEVRSVLGKWKEEKEKAIRKNFLLDIERAKFFDFCEQEHIWYMPLKGSILKSIYPKEGMRQMADNDILFDAACQKKVRDYFISQGYEVTCYAKGNHDVYEKKPVYNFEMHTALFNKNFQPAIAAYYENVKDRLIADPKKCYGYHFNIEDFYVYLTAHAYKHLDGGGIGLRSLMDLYVCHKKYADNWNRAYIEEELQKLDILDFERDSASLANMVFDSEKPLDAAMLDKTWQDMLEIYVGAGTYGKFEKRIENQLQKMQNNKEAITFQTKLKYILRRLFPTTELLKDSYPISRRHPWMVPFCVLHRLVFRSLRALKNISKEIKAVSETGKK